MSVPPKSLNMTPFEFKIIFFLFVMAFIVIMAIPLEGKTTSEETLRDGSGRIIGYITGDLVRGKDRSIIGKIRNGQTYDSSGRKISQNRLPGLLFCK